MKCYVNNKYKGETVGFEHVLRAFLNYKNIIAIENIGRPISVSINLNTHTVIVKTSNNNKLCYKEV